ncbi:MAG TPA: M50 family metallopeptidase [Candidatus Saccharimonadales bacterium]|nr:M50 family metallopeptidase [Candidatus Saccharimonadales bacterium]
MSVVLLIVGLILFIGLVVVHEFGHFLAARRNGVDVEEFGIGFPPRAWAKKTKGGFDFSINWLPLGGFVKLKGESDSAKEKGSLGAATTWTKSKIMLAGVFMNLLVAFGLLTILAWVGMPQLIDKQFTVKSDTKIARNDVLVGYVEPKSPGAKAGLTQRDKIVAIGVDGKYEPVKSASALPHITEKFAGKKVTIQYERNGSEKTAQTQLREKSDVEASKKTDKPKGYLGVSPTEMTLKRSTWSAPIVGAGLIGQFTVATFQGLGTTIAAVFQGEGHKAAEQVSGPVGIVVLLKDGSLLGYQFMLMIIAIISLTLAIMNVLPIPALDGGRLFMVLLSRLFGKQLSEEMEERIVGASFLFLMFLIVLITIVDVKRFF